jgi:PleD family two-component response regulator
MNSITTRVNAYLMGLDEALASELRSVLRQTQCRETKEPGEAEIVFCAWKPKLFDEARGRFPRVPVVVVSPLPDVSGWLDALEAGAADYCAAPFESIQIRWILDTHLPNKRAAFAAA